MRMQERVIDQRVRELRAAGNQAGAAACLLRYRGICPVCGGRVRVTDEEANRGMRLFRCADCQWSAGCSEPQFRGDPVVNLIAIVQTALEIRAEGIRARVQARQAGIKPKGMVSRD